MTSVILGNSYVANLAEVSYHTTYVGKSGAEGQCALDFCLPRDAFFFHERFELFYIFKKILAWFS